MQTVSAQMKARVNKVIADSVLKIERMYHIKMKPINVVYDINSARLYGMACLDENKIRLNPAILNLHPEKYLSTTVPHEVAHLGTHSVWLNAGANWYSRPSGHGYEWKRMMTHCLSIPASRTNYYEIPEGVKVGKSKAQHPYKCECCGESITVGPKVHTKLQAGAVYWHKACGRGRGKLVHVGASAAPKYVAPAVPFRVKPAGVSKFDQCYNIYRANLDLSRAEMIQKFVNEVDMTPAGASTYYSKCKA